jgi:hypothetical protein
VGFGARALFGPLRARLPMVSAAAIVVLGLFSIANRFGMVPGMRWMHDLTVAVPAAGGSSTAPHIHSH